MDAPNRLVAWLADNDKTLSYANIKPAKIGVGTDMYIKSDSCDSCCPEGIIR